MDLAAAIPNLVASALPVVVPSAAEELGIGELFANLLTAQPAPAPEEEPKKPAENAAVSFAAVAAMWLPVPVSQSEPAGPPVPELPESVKAPAPALPVQQQAPVSEVIPQLEIAVAAPPVVAELPVQLEVRPDAHADLMRPAKPLVAARELSVPIEVFRFEAEPRVPIAAAPAPRLQVGAELALEQRATLRSVATLVRNDLEIPAAPAPQRETVAVEHKPAPARETKPDADALEPVVMPVKPAAVPPAGAPVQSAPEPKPDLAPPTDASRLRATLAPRLLRTTERTIEQVEPVAARPGAPELPIADAAPRIEPIAGLLQTAERSSAPPSPAPTAQPAHPNAIAHAERIIEMGTVRAPVSGPAEVQLLLRPENLGRIAVRLVEHSGRVEVMVRSDNQPLRMILADSLPALLGGLAERGWEVRRLEQAPDATLNWWTDQQQRGRDGQEGQHEQKRRQDQGADETAFSLEL